MVAVPVWVDPQLCAACEPADHGIMSLTSSDTSSELRSKTILVVLTGAPGRRRVLSRVLETGVHVLVYAQQLTWATELIPLSQWILGPVDDADAAVCLVRAYISSQRDGSRGACLDGVLCYDEFGVELTAEMAYALGLPYLPPAAARGVRDKHAFRAACMAAGLPTPRFCRISTPLRPTDLDSIEAAGIRFPVVVKPTSCAGSYSVLRANNLAELEAATHRFAAALPGYTAALGVRPGFSHAFGGMLVEELIEGQEVDIDCVVVRGALAFAAVSDNHPPFTADGTHAFIERGGRCPSTLAAHHQADLLALASRVVGLWGSALSGVCHFEAFLTPHGPVPIELNPRIGGAETTTNIATAWGVDLATAVLCTALGVRPQLPAPLLQPIHSAAAPLAFGPLAALQPVIAARGGSLVGDDDGAAVQQQPCPTTPSCTDSSDRALSEASVMSDADLRASSGSSAPASEDGDSMPPQSPGPRTAMPAHNTGYIRLAAPLTHVHSVNFVPDWRGEGVVSDLTVGPSARTSPAFVDAEMYWHPGARVKLPPLGFSALGWLVGRGDSAEEAGANVAQLARDVHITVHAP